MTSAEKLAPAEADSSEAGRLRALAVLAAGVAIVAVVGGALALRYSGPSDKDLAAESCTAVVTADPSATAHVTDVMTMDEFIEFAFDSETSEQAQQLRDDLIDGDESTAGTSYLVTLEIDPGTPEGPLLCLTSVDDGVADEDPLFIPAAVFGLE